MPEKTFWLAYDLSIKGDYPGLYTFLDDCGAKEAGDSVAFIKNFTYNESFLEELKTSIKERVSINPNDRIYIIFYDYEKQQSLGKFIIGKRKAAPWKGYGYSGTNEEDVDA